MDLSVVVASHANPQGCYLTVFALLQQLADLDVEWELIVAADGGTEYQWEKLDPRVKCLRIRTGSPQGTRDAGIRAARAPHALVVEDHVVVSKLKTLYETHKGLGAAMSFPMRFGEGTSLLNVYGTSTNWDGNLWFKQTIYQPFSAGIPYRVPQFGHSCFMVDCRKYLAVGGYTDLLTGWGGEEPLLCLKFWMLGHECWMIPQSSHYHFLADRTGGAMQTEMFRQNFAITKYVLTGNVSAGIQVTPAMRAERRRIESGPFGGDIGRLRAYFQSQGIG